MLSLESMSDSCDASVNCFTDGGVLYSGRADCPGLGGQLTVL